MKKRCAFPILDASCSTNAHMSLICQDILPRVLDILTGRPSTRGVTKCAPEGITVALHVGTGISIPLTFVGSRSGDGGGSEVLAHSPGLSGAFPIQLSELAVCRGQFLLGSTAADTATEESRQLGALCVLETLQHRPVKRVLDEIYRRARRRHFSVVGTESLISVGEKLNITALQLSFPYHCGGEQATKRYFDIRPEACSLFPPAAQHGTKVLTRYGTAVCVGIAVDDTLQVPCVYWHPSGTPAGCLAPAIHGLRALPVGAVPLQYNGPTNQCQMLDREDARRYMNITEGGYDATTWLCEGLFGKRPGEEWGTAAEVVGVLYDQSHEECELTVRDAQGNVTVADDVEVAIT